MNSYSSDLSSYKWVASALTTAEWDALEKYRNSYGVRTVILSSSFEADRALVPVLSVTSPGV